MEHLNLSQTLSKAFKPKYYAVSAIDSSPGSSARSIKFSDETDFFTFPKEHGWNEDEKCFSDTRVNINLFLQEWLFFGLLMTVLQDKSFNRNKVIEGKHIDTKDLPYMLTAWEQRAKIEEGEGTMRMIRAQLALDKAREVVLSVCSLDWKDWKESDDPEEPDGLRESDNSVEPQNCLDPNLALSLMVLGETLTNTKCKIVERFGYSIRGWHGDALEGWGIPSAVVSMMINKGWCVRTVYVLSCQLKLHATALLAASVAYAEIEGSDQPFTILKGHKKCKKDKCVFKSTEDDNKTYKTRHTRSCRGSDCSMIGPKAEDVANIINQDKIPLLEYDQQSSQVKVRPYERFETYATISHVWSDGYGNRVASKLPKCQLGYISRLLRDSGKHDEKQNNQLFWIDTLAIPRHGTYTSERRKAVQRIDEVYRHAKFTIVLDVALGHVAQGSEYFEVAMSILASGWMRRLWTLQEAYLSNKIMFAFRDGDLVDIDDIEEKYLGAKHSLISNLATSARTYYHHIMGPERRTRIFNVPPENRYDVIASVWRSAQWRTINYPAHEVIALAALLEVDYEQTTSMKEGSDLPSDPGKDAAHDHRQKKTPRQLAEMMRELWSLLDEQSPGCIPSGIVFLPGERLPLKGFGWAPSTWMSGQKTDYPDPLAISQSRARIVHGKGLSVKYPGFLLHSKKSDTIFWPNPESSIRFPSDSTLLEWYEVKKAEQLTPMPLGTIPESMRFAILLCRVKPREVDEIALFVNITREVRRKLHGSNVVTKVYEARILCRVWIKREIGINREEKWNQFLQQTDGDEHDFICGEELESNQEWILDGYRGEIAGETAQGELLSSLAPGSAANSSTHESGAQSSATQLNPAGRSLGRQNSPGQSITHRGPQRSATMPVTKTSSERSEPSRSEGLFSTFFSSRRRRATAPSSDERETA